MPRACHLSPKNKKASTTFLSLSKSNPPDPHQLLSIGNSRGGGEGEGLGGVEGEGGGGEGSSEGEGGGGGGGGEGGGEGEGGGGEGGGEGEGGGGDGLGDGGLAVYDRVRPGLPCLITASRRLLLRSYSWRQVKNELITQWAARNGRKASAFLNGLVWRDDKSRTHVTMVEVGKAEVEGMEMGGEAGGLSA
eukprot:1152833-Pelagomonas_calceolata.AAC.2